MGATLGVSTLALAQHLLVAVAGLVIMSLSISTLFGLSNTIVMERTPVSLRGRVSAVTGIAGYGLMPFAGLAVSAYADLPQIGMRGAMGTGAIAFAVVATLVLLMAGKHVSEAPEKAAEHAAEAAGSSH